MNGKWLQSSVARRLFLARLGVGAGVVGASVIGSPAANAQGAAEAAWSRIVGFLTKNLLPPPPKPPAVPPKPAATTPPPPVAPKPAATAPAAVPAPAANRAELDAR